MEGVDDQEDCFPPNVCVRANGKVATLPNPIPTNKPNTEPKRPPRPVNITNLCRLMPPANPNQVSISWTNEHGKSFCCAIYLVRRVTSQTLLRRLQDRGHQPVEQTISLIKAKLVHDEDVIATTSLRVSLLCPLGKMRQTLPCRSSHCNHLQCFDAQTFLMMNEKKASWICPVCDGPASFDSLRLDGLFADLIKKCTDSDEVVFTEDGSWKCYREDIDDESLCSGGLSDPAISNFTRPAPVSSAPQPVKADPEGQQAIIDLTLDSSDDDDDDDTREADEPPSKRPLLTCTSTCGLLPAGIGVSSHCGNSNNSNSSTSSGAGSGSSSSSSNVSGGLSSGTSSVLSLPRCSPSVPMSGSGASVTSTPCLAPSVPSYSPLLDMYDYAAALSRSMGGMVGSTVGLMGPSLQQSQQPQLSLPQPPQPSLPTATPLAFAPYTHPHSEMFEAFGISFDYEPVSSRPAAGRPSLHQPQDLSNRSHSSRIDGTTNGLLGINTTQPPNATISRPQLSHTYSMVGSHLLYGDDVIPVD